MVVDDINSLISSILCLGPLLIAFFIPLLLITCLWNCSNKSKPPTKVPTKPTTTQPPAVKPQQSVSKPSIIVASGTEENVKEVKKSTKIQVNESNEKKKLAKSEDSFESHTPVSLEVKRADEIKTSEPIKKLREDYKTLQHSNMLSSDYDNPIVISKFEDGTKKLDETKNKDTK